MNEPSEEAQETIVGMVDYCLTRRVGMGMDEGIKNLETGEEHSWVTEIREWVESNKNSMLEVRPKEPGFYFVTLYQYKKEKPEHPDYFRDWMQLDGEQWLYDGGYEGCCYVCFIHRKE